MNVGSLFSGVGGIELGFEREGFATKWFVEYEPYCQAILRKHWPNVPIYGDITKVDFTELEKVDVLTGGFPCQDISIAGKGKGIVEGARSSLWKHYYRAIGKLRPKYAVIENVSALTFRGLSNVLADLAEKGYDAEWLDLRASDFGAPHRRERIFIIANAKRCKWGSSDKSKQENATAFTRRANSETCFANSNCNGCNEGNSASRNLETEIWQIPKGKQIRDRRFNEFTSSPAFFFADNYIQRVQSYVKEALQGECGFQRFADVRRVEDLKGRPDIPEPLIRGGNNGVSFRMDRTKCLGNAVVPQCAQFIARLIKEREGN